MSLLPAPAATPSSLSTTNASQWRSTVICHKLLCICYYYSRCFGTVSFGIKRCKENNSNISSINNGVPTQPNSPPNTQLNQRKRCALQAYKLKYTLWFNIVANFILCSCFTYGVLSWWLMDNYVYLVLLYFEIVTTIVCPLLMVIVEVWQGRKLIRALNSLFQLLQDIEELHSSYEIFQWTHVAFVAIIVVTFMYEISFFLVSVLLLETWSDIIIEILENIILIEIWLNLHVATLIYICVEAMYGSLNHYMKHTFILRLEVIQTFRPITLSTQVDHLTTDLAKFIELFKKVHHIGLELHNLWQLPVAYALVTMSFGTISILYYMIWQYFEAGVTHTSYIPYTLKLVFDIMLLSLTAHRTIKSSQLIGCMGLENVVLVENAEWHRQMEQFLCHINLYEFKLNCLGIFNINNAIGLTFISGILTSISIFVPFVIKNNRIQKLLENQN